MGLIIRGTAENIRLNAYKQTYFWKYESQARAIVRWS